jgi:hypothetical protein
MRTVSPVWAILYVLFVIYLLYFYYRIADHVNAWPF